MDPSQSKPRRSATPFSRLIRPFPLVLSLATLLAACGAEEQGLQDDTAVTSAHLETLEQEALCSAELLGGTCRGPWAYRAYVMPCYNEGRAAVCGTESYQEPRTCLVARAGLQAAFSHFVRCSSSSCGSNGRATLESKCVTNLNGDLALVAGNRSGVIGSWSLSGVAREGTAWSATCNVLLQNAGTAQDPACGLDTLWRYRLCRDAQFGDAPPGTCGSQAEWSASTSGLSRSQALTVTPLPDPGTLACSTLEDQPVSPQRQATSIQRAAAQDPYWADLPASTDQEAQARRDLVKQAKLMFELGIASPEEIRGLYELHPQEEMSCGITAMPPVSPSCATWGAEHGVAGTLGLCRRLQSSHVPASLVAAESDRCFELLARAELREQSACAAEYRASAEAMAEVLLAKAFTEIHKPAGAPLQGLDPALRRIDRWYANAKQMFAQDPEALADATGRILGAFWARVREVGAPAPASFPTGAAGSAQAGVMLDELTAARLEADRQVLLAAYTSPAPLGDTPLLLLTADALTPLFQRLRVAAPHYDLACRIQESCTASNANQATRMLRALGAIGAPEELDDTLAAGGLSAPWRPVFTALRDHDDVLKSAYRLAAGRPDAELEELHQPNVVVAAAGLEEMISASAAMWTSYRAHGTLLPRTGSSLEIPLSQETRDAFLELYDEVVEISASRRSDYQADRGTAANYVLANIRRVPPQTRVSLELLLLQNDYDKLSMDLHSLMAAQNQSELAAARTLSSYLELASQPGWHADYPVETIPRTISVAAAAARGSGAAVESVAQVLEVALRDPDLAAQPLEISVAKGDMLTFEVSGTWGPTCGLRATTLVRPQQTLGFTNALTAMTGSEGYEISWSSALLRARRNASESFEPDFSTTSICGVVAASSQIRGDQAADIGAGNASYCRAWQTGRTEADRVTPAQRLQTSVEHAGGLRISGTPFPTAPGGSLLAVEVVGAPDAPRVADITSSARTLP